VELLQARNIAVVQMMMLRSSRTKSIALTLGFAECTLGSDAALTITALVGRAPGTRHACLLLVSALQADLLSAATAIVLFQDRPVKCRPHDEVAYGRAFCPSLGVQLILEIVTRVLGFRAWTLDSEPFQKIAAFQSKIYIKIV